MKFNLIIARAAAEWLQNMRFSCFGYLWRFESVRVYNCYKIDRGFKLSISKCSAIFWRSSFSLHRNGGWIEFSLSERRPKKNRMSWQERQRQMSAVHCFRAAASVGNRVLRVSPAGRLGPTPDTFGQTIVPADLQAVAGRDRRFLHFAFHRELWNQRTWPHGWGIAWQRQMPDPSACAAIRSIRRSITTRAQCILVGFMDQHVSPCFRKQKTWMML